MIKVPETLSHSLFLGSWVCRREITFYKDRTDCISIYQKNTLSYLIKKLKTLEKWDIEDSATKYIQSKK